MFFISKSKKLSRSSSLLSIRRDPFPRCFTAAAQALIYLFLFYSAGDAVLFFFFWRIESFDKYLHVFASDELVPLSAPAPTVIWNGGMLKLLLSSQACLKRRDREEQIKIILPTDPSADSRVLLYCYHGDWNRKEVKLLQSSAGSTKPQAETQTSD